jgi:hypothetical protein
MRVSNYSRLKKNSLSESSFGRDAECRRGSHGRRRRRRSGGGVVTPPQIMIRTQRRKLTLYNIISKYHLPYPHVCASTSLQTDGYGNIIIAALRARLFPRMISSRGPPCRTPPPAILPAVSSPCLPRRKKKGASFLDPCIYIYIYILSDVLGMLGSNYSRLKKNPSRTHHSGVMRNVVGGRTEDDEDDGRGAV